MFKVDVIGNLGVDAEVKRSDNYEFISFRLAHTDKWTDGAGQEHSETIWVDCVLNNVQSKVLPFLKRGVKVFVRGNGRLRVFSSKKERRMVAGLTINVIEVELCGGAAEDVPPQLIDPSSGAIYDVSKHYFVNADTKDMKKDELGSLVDRRGNRYLYNKGGNVIPAPEQQLDAPEITPAE